MTPQEDVKLEKNYLKSIKERDCFKCQNPECRSNKKNEPLTVHHIDYDKANFAPWNLITLCLGCKTETRYNKAYSKAVYTEIIDAKYPNTWNHLKR